MVCPQQEAAGCDPLDELYDALAEVVAAEDTTECYKSYLLVLNLLQTLRIHWIITIHDELMVSMKK